MVHERGDELAAVLPRQLALEKSRHRFPENLRAKQRHGEQRGERAGHRRRVHVTVFGRTKGDAGRRRDEFNYPDDEEGKAGGERESLGASRRRKS